MGLHLALILITVVLGLNQVATACTLLHLIDATSNENYYYDTSSDPLSILLFAQGSDCVGASYDSIITYGSTTYTCTPGTIVESTPDYEEAESVCDLNHADLVDQGVYTVSVVNVGVGFFTVTHTQATVTATLTTTIQTTPVVTQINTVTNTAVSEYTPAVVTTTIATKTGTQTNHPPRSTTFVAAKTVTHTSTIHPISLVYSTKTYTATCTSAPLPRRSAFAAISQRENNLEEHSPLKRRFITEVRRQTIVKRVGPNGPLTTTVTDPTPSVVFTPGPVTSTETDTSIVISTSTVTLPAQTSVVLSGKSIITVTAPASTRTITTTPYTTVTKTSVQKYTVTVKTTTTPAGVKKACPT